MSKYLIKSGDVEVTAETLAEVLGVLEDRSFHNLSAADVSVTLPGLENAEVPLVRNNYGAIGIAIAGDQSEALKSLLDPILPGFVKDGQVQQPWQMPRKQWMALVAVGSFAYGAIPGLDPAFSNRTYASNYNGSERQVGLTSWLDIQLLEKLGYGHNGPNYHRGSGPNSRHDVHVAHALASNKPVPAQAVEDMLRKLSTGNYDLSFARAVAERPFLRGRADVDQLRTLLQVYERENGKLITEESAESLFAIARSLGPDPSSVKMDDALYASGRISALPAKVVQPSVTEPIRPSGPKAEALLLQLNLAIAADSIELLEDQRLKSQVSRRVYEQSLTFFGNPASYSKSATWANQVVEALETRDIVFLLRAMDSPDAQNTVSKRFAREQFGMNSLYLKSAERTAGIFRFCGFDAAQQAQWETQATAAREVARAARDAKDAREYAIEVATRNKIKSDGVVYTWKDLIDLRVSEGFTAMTSHPRGSAVKHYLLNPTTNMIMPLQRKDGSFAYAELAVADHKAATEAAALTAGQLEVEEAPREREVQRG